MDGNAVEVYRAKKRPKSAKVSSQTEATEVRQTKCEHQWVPWPWVLCAGCGRSASLTRQQALEAAKRGRVARDARERRLENIALRLDKLEETVASLAASAPGDELVSPHPADETDAKPVRRGGPGKRVARPGSQPS